MTLLCDEFAEALTISNGYSPHVLGSTLIKLSFPDEVSQILLTAGKVGLSPHISVSMSVKP